MTRYLLDTNICAFLFRNKYGIPQKIKSVGLHNCAVSQLTVLELMVGFEYTLQKTGKNQFPKLEEFLKYVSVVPIDSAMKLAAGEKARLQLAGTPIDDLIDVLIAATAIQNNMIMVTENVKHFSLFNGVVLENWVTRN